jgi:hypothetical protein
MQRLLRFEQELWVTVIQGLAVYGAAFNGQYQGEAKQ